MSEHSLTDDPQATRAENLLAAKILIAVVAVLILAVVIVALFGWPALGVIGLIATALIFVVMMAFTMGS